MSTAQVDRLGERLRTGGTISEADLILLQGFREENVDALRYVQDVVAAALGDVAQTSRIKTIQTLLDKLRRQSTKLSRVQDIAGIRVVKEMNRLEQDAMVQALVQALPGAKVQDRRATPSYGYRAVHVVARQGRCSVEIQVRTHRQDLWAQIVERLGDRWGRQIRYGGEPDDPERPVGTQTRRGVWHLVLQLADVINGFEELETVTDLPADSHHREDLLDLMGQIDVALAALGGWIERSEGL
jgi:hypothetical protein